VAERVVERVDESLKADIMHWAAFYVSCLVCEWLVSKMHVFTGNEDADWKQEDLSS
jgi:hypothetical protein